MNFYLKNSQHTEIVFAFFLSIIFASTIKHEPLYSYNQNTYLIQGVSNAVDSPLQNDWLVNQTDHLSLFTWVTEILYSVTPSLFYVSHSLMAAVLLISLYLLAAGVNQNRGGVVVVSAFFLAFYFAKRYFGALGGVAEQYILGNYFQPSIFGVLLVTSAALFISGKQFAAILACVLAAYFNPTYLLQAAFLVFSYQLILISRHNWRSALVSGLIALVLILPLVINLYLDFGNAPPGVLQKSQEILVLERMTRHTLVEEWLFTRDTAQSLFIIALALVIYRKDSSILILMATPLLLSIMFVAFASLTENLTMLLLFAQRSSTWLVPIASSLIIFRLISAVSWHKVSNLLKNSLIIFTVFSLLVVSGVAVSRTIRDHQIARSDKLHDYLSSLDYSDGSLLIPINRQKIRLSAKVPVFVDYKSHPYKAVEVVEWYDRVLLARKFHSSDIYATKRSVLNEINMEEKIAFILVNAKQPIADCAPIYEDQKSIVYSVSRCF